MVILHLYISDLLHMVQWTGINALVLGTGMFFSSVSPPFSSIYTCNLVHTTTTVRVNRYLPGIQDKRTKRIRDKL